MARRELKCIVRGSQQNEGKLMKQLNKLKWFTGLFSLVIALVWLTGCGDDSNGRNGNGGPAGTNAPGGIAGSQITHTINSGSSPFPVAGIFVLTADSSGNYTITGVTNSTGSYVFTSDTNANTGTLELQNDTAFGNVNETLIFDNSRSGTFSAQSAS